MASSLGTESDAAPTWQAAFRAPEDV